MFPDIFAKYGIPDLNDDGLINLITYAHIDDPKGHRFRQFVIDPIPVWAVDVQIDHSRD